MLVVAERKRVTEEKHFEACILVVGQDLKKIDLHFILFHTPCTYAFAGKTLVYLIRLMAMSAESSMSRIVIGRSECDGGVGKQSQDHHLTITCSEWAER